ncbi:extradiol dioxygenase [Leptospira kobayashii]|uniref:Extradiol dioxygenase n=1 Tax=Leptospira kobayashii TaxID=1917830 RepID=A0ABM7UKY9_9LEPT|nr:VOC family protein [Leptospira kobayashii]BDA79597.1 extradiol dioxygenase [Leptospira kobayashii]
MRVVTQTFLNLPVKNLDKSIQFFTKLGFTFNPDFTDEKATCMIINEHSFAMLLVEEYFETFSKLPISKGSREYILALSLTSRSEVDEMVKIALSSGGKPANDAQDHGFMYSCSFLDPDDHLWEVFFMDALPPKE